MGAIRERVPNAIKSATKIARARAAEAVGSHRYSFPALAQLDRRLLDYLPTDPGTFLEIGANDGYSQSNTYYLERARGWSGILIEPLPSLFRLCQAHRRGSKCYNVACVGKTGPQHLSLVDRGLMSVSVGISNNESARIGEATREVVVPTRTITSVIDDSGFPSIDFMSIDVEGAELAVLDGLDLARHAPKYLLVETEEPDAVKDVLAPTMRPEAKMTSHDYLFVRKNSLQLK